MMSQEDRDYRLSQLRRLQRQVDAAIEYLKSDQPFMPLQNHVHPLSLMIGDFVIVDLKGKKSEKDY